MFAEASGGFRLGAWDYLQWRNVTAITDDKGEIISAKLLIYDGEPEEYYTFITPEAYRAIKDWMDFRSSYGERITEESWLMRDLWQTTNMNYGAKWGLATNPKKLQSIAVKRLLDRALWEQGIKHTLPMGKKRHERKGAHGYRKFYKSRAEQVMKPINVEITMGHDLGISESYWRPTEAEVLEDFLKAVPLLTINGENIALQKQIKELTEKTTDNAYLLKAKLQEKDDALTTLSDQVMKLMIEVQKLKEK